MVKVNQFYGIKISDHIDLNSYSLLRVKIDYEQMVVDYQEKITNAIILCRFIYFF
jgi:hypothetical protein